MMSIGKAVIRTDGRAKVTGQAIYVDDLRPEGCLYGATVRSQRAHARIIGMDLDPSFDWTDITVVTAKDIPGENVVALMTDDQPVLVDGECRHVMEAVALVAAPTRERAMQAVHRVTLRYEDLPVLLDPAASQDSPIRIFGTDNVFKKLVIDRGSSPGGGVVHSATYHTSLAEQLYIEPQGMLAVPENDGSITIIGSLQCPYYIHKALKRVLGHSRFHVVQAVTGGGFGGKEEFPSMVAAHATLLAIKTGRPVKMIYRRDEDLRASTKRHPAIIHITSECSPEGELLSWDARVIVDGGAYNTLTPVVLSRLVLHVTGPYRIPKVHLEGVAVATHTPPNGAYRGFGAPQAQWAVERHMDRIARELGIDPLELRRKNLLKDGDLTATGGVLKATAGFQVLEEALEAARAPLPERAPPPGAGKVHWKRGRGLALAFHGCGFTGNGESWLKGKAALELVGTRLRILTGSTDIGQGTDTIFPQIVASELGIPVEQVYMAPHDTALVPDSGPTVASRTTMVVGSVVQSCAKKLRLALQAETGLATDDFAALLAARPAGHPLQVEHVYEPDASIRWNDADYSGDAYPTYGWSANIVDLDVDPDTGELRYLRLVTATDVGRAIHPVLVSGQIEGGALQALGWANLEEIVRDSQGCMRNDRLTNYIIPTSLDAPEMVTRLVEVPYAAGPFGAKGVGELPLDAPAAAAAAALEQAIGLVLDDLPMTPERVLLAMERGHAA